VSEIGVQALAIRSVAFAGAAHLTFQVAQAGAGLLIAVLLVRLLGPSDFGTYTLVLAVATAFTVPSQLAISNLVVRHTAQYLHAREFSALAGLLSRLRWIAIATGATLLSMLLAYAFVTPTEGVFSPVLTGLLAGVLIPVVCHLNTQRAFLTGLGHPLKAQSLETTLRVLFCLGLVIPFALKRPMTPAAAMALHLGAGLLALGIGWLIASAAAPMALSSSAPRFNDEQWLKTSTPLLAAGLGQVVMSQFELLALGWFGSTADAGVYRAAVQIAGLSTFPAIAASALFAPRFARLAQTSGMAGVQSLFRTVFVMVALPALCLITMAAIFGDTILYGLYGDHLRGHQSLLVATSVAQAFNALVIMTITVHSMLGNQIRVLKGGATGALTNLAVAIILVPILGAFGAAIASGSGYVVALAMLSKLEFHSDKQKP
jgi:O-antigen/teichoic acid export membrane protein